QVFFSNLGGSIAQSQTPLTTRGDLWTIGASGQTRLAVGVANRAVISNGTDPSWGQIDLSTSIVVNTLPQTLGGTGGNTRQAAINALLGLNTAGDFAIYDGTNVVRLARGTAGQCVVYTSTSPFIQPGSCASGAIGGTGTTNRFSVFTGTNTIGDSPF